MCRELGFTDFDVVRLEEDAWFRLFIVDAISVPLKYVNALSDMVEVWAGLGGGEGARGSGGVPQVVQIQPLALR